MYQNIQYSVLTGIKDNPLEYFLYLSHTDKYLLCFVVELRQLSELRHTDIITLKQGNTPEGEGDNTQLPSLGIF